MDKNGLISIGRFARLTDPELHDRGRQGQLPREEDGSGEVLYDKL